MIKNINKRKLSRTSSHRRSLLRNLATSLFIHEKVVTTYAKAKEVQRFAEKLLTIASKKNDSPLNNIRRVASEIKSKDALKKIMDVIVPRYQTQTPRNSGRIAVYKAGYRKSDNALMAVVKLV